MTEAAQIEDTTLEVPTDADKLADIEITIDGDKTEIKEAPAASADSAKKEEIPAEAGIDELKKQLTSFRQRAEAAERAARESEGRVAAVSRNAIDANLNMIVSSIETAKGASGTAKADYQRAMEAGDYAKAAEAQEQMADARANLLRLQERKSEMESGRQTQQTPQPVSEVERIASQLSAPSAAWVRAHPDVAKNFNKAEAAHRYAVDIEGVTVDTPDYFKRVEEILGMRKSEKTADGEIEATPTRKSPPAQAPVTQSTQSLRTGQASRQSVTLTTAEREIAREMNMTDREYAIEKLAAIRDGQIKS